MQPTENQLENQIFDDEEPKSLLTVRKVAIAGAVILTAAASAGMYAYRKEIFGVGDLSKPNSSTEVSPPSAAAAAKPDGTGDSTSKTTEPAPSNVLPLSAPTKVQSQSETPNTGAGAGAGAGSGSGSGSGSDSGVTDAPTASTSVQDQSVSTGQSASTDVRTASVENSTVSTIASTGDSNANTSQATILATKTEELNAANAHLAASIQENEPLSARLEELRTANNQVPDLVAETATLQNQINQVQGEIGALNQQIEKTTSDINALTTEPNPPVATNALAPEPEAEPETKVVMKMRYQVDDEAEVELGDEFEDKSSYFKKRVEIIKANPGKNVKFSDGFVLNKKNNKYIVPLICGNANAKKEFTARNQQKLLNAIDVETGKINLMVPEGVDKIIEDFKDCTVNFDELFVKEVEPIAQPAKNTKQKKVGIKLPKFDKVYTLKLASNVSGKEIPEKKLKTVRSVIDACAGLMTKYENATFADDSEIKLRKDGDKFVLPLWDDKPAVTFDTAKELFDSIDLENGTVKSGSSQGDSINFLELFEKKDHVVIPVPDNDAASVVENVSENGTEGNNTIVPDSTEDDGSNNVNENPPPAQEVPQPKKYDLSFYAPVDTNPDISDEQLPNLKSSKESENGKTLWTLSCDSASDRAKAYVALMKKGVDCEEKLEPKKSIFNGSLQIEVPYIRNGTKYPKHYKDLAEALENIDENGQIRLKISKSKHQKFNVDFENLFKDVTPAQNVSSEVKEPEVVEPKVEEDKQIVLSLKLTSGNDLPQELADKFKKVTDDENGVDRYEMTCKNMAEYAENRVSLRNSLGNNFTFVGQEKLKLKKNGDKFVLPLKCDGNTDESKEFEKANDLLKKISGNISHNGKNCKVDYENLFVEQV